MQESPGQSERFASAALGKREQEIGSLKGYGRARPLHLPSNDCRRFFLP